MASPVKDAKNKIQAKWPGATVHSRGKGWIRHQHPTSPNRFALDTQVGGLGWHFGDEPFTEAHEVDTAWQPTTGAWDYEMTLNDFQTYARGTFNVGNLFQFEMGGESLAFDPQSINWIDENNSRQQIAIKQAVSAVVNDDILKFPNAYKSGIHFQYQNQTTRLQKLITIDSFSAIDTTLPAGNEIWFEAEFSMLLSSGIDFYLDGVKWTRANGVRVKTVNNIEVRDAATGTQVLWYLGLPRAYDSNEQSIIGEIEVRRQGGPLSLFITIRIPKTWIDAAVFPIYIDPTIEPQVSAAGDDATWLEGTSALNTEAVVFGYGNHTTTRQNCFGRFAISGPVSGATCDVAYVIYTCNTNRSSTTVNAILAAIDANDPAAPTTYAGAEGATRTTATVNWNNVGSWTADTQYNSPEIKTIIQELWDSGFGLDGEHIVIYTEDNGSTVNIGTNRLSYYYEVSTTDALILHIEYTGDLSISKSDTVTTTDTPALSPLVIPNLVESESVTVTDSPAMYLGLALAESDSVTVTDTPSFEALLLNVAELDTVTVADSPSVSGLALLDLSISKSDGVTVGDTAAMKGGDMGVTITDAAPYRYTGVRVVDG